MTQPPAGWGTHGAAGGAEAAPVCPRHPDRVTYIRCQRCGRPTCAECQRSAAVGVQCVDCVRELSKGDRRQVTTLGGRAGSDRPVVTIGIIVICIIVWIGEQISPWVFEEVAFAPALGMSEPWRLLTSAFAHSPSFVMHIGFNMLALWLVGGYLERMLGWARYVAVYLVSALAGSVTWLLFQPVDPGDPDAWAPIVGASGAVFGLFGALVVLHHKLGRDTSGMIATIAINAVIGFVVPNVAWEAHLGGLVAGGLLALGLAASAKARRPVIAWAAIIGVLVLVLLLWVGKYVLSPHAVLPFA